MSASALSWTAVLPGGFSHQKQDLWMADESQSSGQFPAGAAAVPVSDGSFVVVELQPLQEVTHHLWRKDLGYKGKDLKETQHRIFEFQKSVTTHCKWNIKD